MKRLVKKSAEVEAPIDVEVGESIELDADPKYQGLDMNQLSLPGHRDGAVLVDGNENVVRWGLNGEAHADLLEKYYNIAQDNNDLRLDIDDYVVPGVYLKDFLGHETVILYNDNVADVESIIINEKPGARVYVDDWDGGIQRIARLK